MRSQGLGLTGLILASAMLVAMNPYAAAQSGTPAGTDWERALKGYDITPTGLTPEYPAGYACSPLTSLYASWTDVDGTRRDEIHSGVDGGRLHEDVLAPAPGTVRRVWIADWGQGREGALLIVHTRAELNLTAGANFYYAAYYHLNFHDIEHLQGGQRIARGERIAQVSRPGGKSKYLPEVHLETYEVDDDAALAWSVSKRGTEYFENPSYRLIDPLYLLSLEVRPTPEGEVLVQPFERGRDYSAFKGFTYFLPCRRR
jgi:hypothetical protein